jgi:chemotaxis protein MotB
MQLYRLKSSGEGWLTSYADLITNLLIFFVLIISASAVQTGKMEKIIESISQNRATDSLATAATEVKAELAKAQLAANVRAELTDAGLEIVFDSGVTFDSGSAAIIPSMVEPMAKVLEVIKPYSQRYQVAIEGHTDERPLVGGAFKSNWELSSARAMAIRERLEGIGIDPKRLRVEAYADTRPLAGLAAGGADKETFLARHRRVVIRLY